MARIALYIVRQMLPWFAVTLAAASLLFVATQLLRIAPVFLGADAGAGEIAKGLALLLVPVVGWALAPAFAVTVFAVGGRMAADGELVALDAAGLPRTVAAAGPIAAAFAVAGLSAAIWLSGAPAACGALRVDAARLAGRAIAGRISAGSFAEPAPGITVYADAVRGSRLEGVLVEDARDPARPIRIAAAAAELRAAPGDAVALAFERGEVFVEGDPGAVVRFDTLDLAAPFGREPGALDAFLPWTMAAATATLLARPPPGVEADAWRFALWRRVAAPIGFLTLAAVASGLAFAIPWRRRGLAIGCAAGVFLAFHAAGRLGEVLLAAGALGPIAAALAPAIAVAVLGATIAAATALARRAADVRARRSPVVEKN